MTEPIQGSAPIRDTAAVNAGVTPRTGAASEINFRALLDRIERSAAQLSDKSRQELSRESLADAVADARSSLEQVLTLKERLLEEWRAAQRTRD